MSTMPSSKSIAPAGANTGKRKRGRGRHSVVAVVMGLFVVSIMFMPTAMIFAVGMVPTLVAFISGRDPDRYAPIAVGSLNFCGVMPTAIDLWQTGHTIANAARILSDPLNWLIMYAAAAIGWLIYFTVPAATQAFIAHSHQAQIAKKQKLQKELLAEWGRAVTGLPEDEDLPPGTES